jgi:hypothetical protein
MNMRVLVIALGALLAVSGSARAQLVDPVEVAGGLVKGTAPCSTTPVRSSVGATSPHDGPPRCLRQSNDGSRR